MTTLSHEIRTPLTALVGLCELMLSGPVEAEQRERILQVRRSGMQVLELVESTLDEAAAGEGRLVVNHQPFALPRLLADVVDLVRLDAEARGTHVRTSVGPGCPERVRGDGPRIRQVLVNLVGNAVKFTEDGVVALEVDVAGEGELRFTVADTGTGMPAEALRRVFRPFERVVREGQPGPSGTGLGLSISQRLVSAMGGRIEVESEERVGSVFGFTLPLPAEPANPCSCEQSSGTAGTADLSHRQTAFQSESRALRILLAEDDAVSRRVLTLLLRRLGHDVDAVPDGAAAVQAAGTDAYDVVLLDSQMPGLDGAAAAAAIRASEGAGEPVWLMALSGATSSAERSSLVDAGVDGLLVKPVDLVGLADALAGVPRRASAAAARGAGGLSVLPLAG